MTLLSDAIQKIKLFFGPDSRPLLREMDVTKFYGNMFSLENIDKLTWKKFLGFLDEKNNHHWSYLFRVQNHFNESVEELIPAVKILLDESMDITERLRLTSRGAE